VYLLTCYGRRNVNIKTCAELGTIGVLPPRDHYSFTACS